MADYERVLIVGVGLLGGSLGMALLRRKLAAQVVGWGRRPEALQQALELGAISEVSHDLPSACAGTDAVVICTPVQQVVQNAAEAAQYLTPGAWITDVGSIKGSICSGLPAAVHPFFCGAHPLAGSEKSGVAFADAQLFQDRLTIVTPTDDTPADLADRVAKFWEQVGSQTLRMTPDEHDQAVARISHLPHLLASALAGVTPDGLLPLAASGWCDTTRVAAGNVELWRQIMCENRSPLLAAARKYRAALDEWIEALERGDDERLQHLLQTGKQQRDSVGN